MGLPGRESGEDALSEPGEGFFRKENGLRGELGQDCQTAER